jgi:hypothetical protein
MHAQCELVSNLFSFHLQAASRVVKLPLASSRCLIEFTAPGE